MRLRTVAEELLQALEELPRLWDGRRAILEMKAGGDRHWKQMEWIGFYFQFLCSKYLATILTLPGPRYGNAEFDGFNTIPWDFKAHAANTSSHQIIVNDTEAIEHAIAQYGSVGVILATGEVEYNDENRTFQRWHEELKGGASDYTRERIARGAWSRLRKVRFHLRQVAVMRLNKQSLNRAGTFQVNFRNADGSPRRAKVILDLERAEKSIIAFHDF